MIDYLLNISTRPEWLFVAIILASYLLEDLAIISAALLAADQMISVPMAASAIMLGIMSGDAGLYVMGYFARYSRWLTAKIKPQNKDSRYYKMVSANLLKNILLVRFVPGLRFLFYTSCGLFRVDFKRFLLGVFLSTFLWVLVVFGTFYLAGSSAWAENSSLKWLLIPLAIIMLYVSNRHSIRNLKQV